MLPYIYIENIKARNVRKVNFTRPTHQPQKNQLPVFPLTQPVLTFSNYHKVIIAIFGQAL
jgi:hypothetical protein